MADTRAPRNTYSGLKIDSTDSGKVLLTPSSGGVNKKIEVATKNVVIQGGPWGNRVQLGGLVVNDFRDNSPPFVELRTVAENGSNLDCLTKLTGGFFVQGKIHTESAAIYCNGADPIGPENYMPYTYQGTAAGGGLGEGSYSTGGTGGGGAGWSFKSPNFSILAREFDATSDVRIKRDIEPLKIDSETFMKINPVSYKYKDPAEGDRRVSGFIGQEIVKVLPTTVKASTQFIPNILQMCQVADDMVTVACKLPDDKAKRVKCMSKSGKELLFGIKSTTEGTVVLDKPLDVGDTDAKKIFVYGTEVSDFLTVDYVQLVPELVKHVQELTKRLEKLEKSGGGGSPGASKPFPPELEKIIKEQERKADEEVKRLKDKYDKIADDKPTVPDTDTPIPDAPAVPAPDAPAAPDAPTVPDAPVETAEAKPKKKRAPRKRKLSDVEEK